MLVEERVLNEAGQAYADDFEINYSFAGCTCFLSPPCDYCTHPGNPTNLAEDDELWTFVMVEKADGWATW